ncbi:MAG: hypothetical protein J5486_06905 [Bacteroidaceae bacterium]|nr:hypothetical protein [Bacteroidaceae bacterium]
MRISTLFLSVMLSFAFLGYVQADDAVIEHVQLPFSCFGWSGGAHELTNNDINTYQCIVDFSDVAENNVNFKLLVKATDKEDWQWLGIDKISIEAPSGWTQNPENDNQIQLNLSTAGTKYFTFTAIWAGGTDETSGWTLKIEDATTATINEVKLPGNFNDWSGDGYIFTRVGESKVWTLDADFSSQGNNVVFKLQPIDEEKTHWLGWGDCIINAPSGLVEDSNDNDHNIKLNLSGSKKYRFTATWGGGSIASGGWTLTIDPAVSVSAAGYTAYTTYYGVTFPAGMTAYKVTSTGTTAHLETVSEAPHNTPLILKANEGDYFLTLKNNAASVGVNLLNVSDGSSVTGDGSTIYALGNKDGVGFYLVANGVSVPARKPYLEIGGGGVKSFLAFDFNDTPTGLTSVEPKDVVRDGWIYNLAGQRVSKTTKGLYIVNGKKVMLK